VNSQLFSFNGSLGALRDVLKMLDRAVFHSHDQIVTFHRKNFAPSNPNYLATLARILVVVCTCAPVLRAKQYRLSQ